MLNEIKEEYRLKGFEDNIEEMKEKIEELLSLKTEADIMGYYFGVYGEKQKLLDLGDKEVYSEMPLKNSLLPIELYNFNEEMYEQEEELIQELAKKQGATPELQDQDIMAYIGLMGNIHAQAREILITPLREALVQREMEEEQAKEEAEIAEIERRRSILLLEYEKNMEYALSERIRYVNQLLTMRTVEEILSLEQPREWIGRTMMGCTLEELYNLTSWKQMQQELREKYMTEAEWIVKNHQYPAIYLDTCRDYLTNDKTLPQVIHSQEVLEEYQLRIQGMDEKGDCPASWDRMGKVRREYLHLQSLNGSWMNWMDLPWYDTTWLEYRLEEWEENPPEESLQQQYPRKNP